MDADFAKIPESYHATWSTFDNATGATTLIGESVGRTTRLQAPTDLPSLPNAFIRVDVSAVGGQHESWAKPVHAYFRNIAGGWKLVGFERLPAEL